MYEKSSILEPHNLLSIADKIRRKLRLNYLNSPFLTISGSIFHVPSGINSVCRVGENRSPIRAEYFATTFIFEKSPK
jgi:hypothetical protein